jgi:hypothetical protein
VRDHKTCGTVEEETEDEGVTLSKEKPADRQAARRGPDQKGLFELVNKQNTLSRMVGQEQPEST